MAGFSTVIQKKLFGDSSKPIDDAGRMYDERFDTRKREIEKNNNFQVDLLRKQGYEAPPEVKLSDFEGMPVITSMADRTDAGHYIVGANGQIYEIPVELRGGQNYMFDGNGGQVWASARKPVNDIMKLAAELKSQTGQDPLYMPWRMSPTGGDFAAMTGEVMLAHASAAMTKKTKSDLDKKLKAIIPDWKGVDSEAARGLYQNAPFSARQKVMQVMDRDFRDNGGLSYGQARLAVTEPSQVNARVLGIQNVGRINVDGEILPSTHPSYPFGVPGEGVGRLVGAEDASVNELMPDLLLGELQQKVVDPIFPTQENRRSMEMMPKGALITEGVLRNLSDRGVNVAVTGLPTGLLAGDTGNGLTVRNSDGSSRPMNDMELAMYEDSQRSIAPALEALAPDEGYAYGDMLPVKRMTDEDAREEDMFGGFRPAFPNMVRDTAADLIRASQALRTGMLDEQAFMNVMAP